MKNSEKTLDMIVNLCKNRGFIYPGSEIYGGLANSWDYGPLGVEFKNNVKKAWMKKFVQESPYNVGLDAAILMNPQTWVTTGHVSSFSDPLLDCRACKSRHRADKLISECEQGKGVDVDAMTFDEMDEFIATHPEVVCPVCGKHDFTPIRKFNLMFKTAIGVTDVYKRQGDGLDLNGAVVDFGDLQLKHALDQAGMGAADGDAGAAVRCQYIHDIDLHGLALGEGLAGDLLVAGQHSTAAVSYTHLDVYKRQVIGSSFLTGVLYSASESGSMSSSPSSLLMCAA